MHIPPNDGRHINGIIGNTTCKKHKAEAGVACWDVYVTASQRFAPAVCGSRIKRAGYNGKISPSSLSQKAPGGRPTGPRRP